MGRIEDTFARLKKEKKKALVAYLTAGDPDAERAFEAAMASVMGRAS